MYPMWSFVIYLNRTGSEPVKQNEKHSKVLT